MWPLGCYKREVGGAVGWRRVGDPTFKGNMAGITVWRKRKETQWQL